MSKKKIKRKIIIIDELMVKELARIADALENITACIGTDGQNSYFEVRDWGTD